MNLLQLVLALVISFVSSTDAIIPCGSSAKLKQIIFTNPLGLLPQECSIKIEKSSPSIKQLDIFVANMTLADQDESGHCKDDSFNIVGLISQKLCGQTKNQLIQVAMQDSVELVVKLSDEKVQRGWEIIITQVDDKDVNLAPPGCKQFFYNETGRFKSWNHGRGMIANSQYWICFKLLPGFCAIKFTGVTFDVGNCSQTASSSEDVTYTNSAAGSYEDVPSSNSADSSYESGPYTGSAASSNSGVPSKNSGLSGKPSIVPGHSAGKPLTTYGHSGKPLSSSMKHAKGMAAAKMGGHTRCKQSAMYRSYKAETFKSLATGKHGAAFQHQKHQMRVPRSVNHRDDKFRCHGSDYVEFPPSNENAFCGNKFNDGRPLVVNAPTPYYVYVNTFGQKHGKGFMFNYQQLPCGV